MEHIEIEERSYLQNIQKTKEVIQKLKAMARHYEISFQEEDSSVWAQKQTHASSPAIRR